MGDFCLEAPDQILSRFSAAVLRQTSPGPPATMERGLTGSAESDRVARWLEALDARHLADLTPKEVARALRALSSCYVERRARLARGGALDSAGKRAAFALFYAPGAVDGVREVQDVGCGTGSAGAAWALESGAASIRGFDASPWAVAEARWTYSQLGLAGRAAARDVNRATMSAGEGTATVVAYVANELADPARTQLLQRLLTIGRDGDRILLIEPIARRAMPWWPEWERAFVSEGGRADEWRFPSSLPQRQGAGSSRVTSPVR